MPTNADLLKNFGGGKTTGPARTTPPADLTQEVDINTGKIINPKGPGAVAGSTLASGQPDPAVIAALNYEQQRQAADSNRQKGLAANIAAGASNTSLLGSTATKRKTLLGY